MSATIKKAESDTLSLNAKIDDLVQDISTSEADLKGASTIREKENAEFVVAEKELVDTISTLERAINILERKLSTSAMLQEKVDSNDMGKLVRVLSAVVDAASLCIHDKKTLLGLVQNSQKQEDDSLEVDVGAPDPAAYNNIAKALWMSLRISNKRLSHNLMSCVVLKQMAGITSNSSNNLWKIK